jgi:hypothetical protein
MEVSQVLVVVPKLVVSQVIFLGMIFKDKDLA